MPRCQFCHQDLLFRNSHIVPEFLYDGLYNANHQMIGIHGRGSKGRKVLHKGIRERLFCEACEQHFNEHFEKPCRESWVQSCPLLDPWFTEDVRWIKVDYAPFKLFHLSVLFRAGVSSLPTFAEVSLGPHQERMRRMLLSRDPGRGEQYPIFGHAVVHHETRRVVRIVSKAQASRFGGRRCYGIMYGGAQWWVCVASDTNHDFQELALRVDGSMPFAAIAWNEVSVLQEARSALRNATA